MADEQNTPSDGSNANETTPIEPVVVADQGPAEVSAPVVAPKREPSPWIRRGLVAAGVVGLMAVSGVAGFAIGHESGDRESFEELTAQRGPMGDGGEWGMPGRDGDGYGNDRRGYGDEDGFGHHHGDGPMGGWRGTEDMPGMPNQDRFDRDGVPGMGQMPTPEQMLEWLQDQGFDMQQFMEQFGPGGMGQGMRQSS